MSTTFTWMACHIYFSLQISTLHHKLPVENLTWFEFHMTTMEGNPVAERYGVLYRSEKEKRPGMLCMHVKILQHKGHRSIAADRRRKERSKRNAPCHPTIGTIGYLFKHVRHVRSKSKNGTQRNPRHRTSNKELELERNDQPDAKQTPQRRLSLVR